MRLSFRGTVLRAKIELSNNAELSAVLMVSVTHIPKVDGFEFLPISGFPREDENRKAICEASCESFPNVHRGVRVFMSCFAQDLRKDPRHQEIALVKEGDLIKGEIFISRVKKFLDRDSSSQNTIRWIQNLSFLEDNNDQE